MDERNFVTNRPLVGIQERVAPDGVVVSSGVVATGFLVELIGAGIFLYEILR